MSERDTTARWTAEGLRQRARGLEAFARWEKAHPHRIEGAAALAAVGGLYELLPLEARSREADPDFEGVQRLHAIFERWGRARDFA